MPGFIDSGGWLSQRFAAVAMGFILAGGPASLAGAATPAAASLGFDPARLARLDAAVQRHIDDGQLAGGLVYVARGDQVAHLGSYGKRDLATGEPFTPDTILRLASMSKAVTTVAALMLYEEGRFLLNDPVHKFLPAFKNQVVAVAPPPGSTPDLKFVTVPARRAITIRDLMRHTAGLTYGDGVALERYQAARLHGWYLTGHDETIAEVVDRLATLPLHGQPGEAWQYGYATDVLGRLIEVVSGQPLDQFLAERIFKPLRMRDTSFFLPPEKLPRFAPVYGIEEGKLVVQETAAASDFVRGPRKCFSGGAGLISTLDDYARFLRLLLQEGELEGVRLLSPGTVALLHANHTGDKYQRDTHGFGLGFWVNNDPGAYGELMGPGAYGWGSAYYPQYFVDPERQLVGIFMTQLRPTGGLDLNQRFKVLIYQALVR